MIVINKKSDCTGCSACASICPKKCISMIEDEEGFDYPSVEQSKCVNCHLCEKVCPMNKAIKNYYDTYTLCAQNVNEKIRRQSSAGGIIGAVYQTVFKENGIVFGVGVDKDNIVKFMQAENLEECLEKKMFSSKYVAAELGNVLSCVREKLQTGCLVCFVGLPCQVSGLVSYLEHDYENLWLIDLTCYGVPSRKLYRKYIQYIENKYHSKITNIQFRNKEYGYAAPTLSITLKSGKTVSQNSSVKSFLRCFFKDISSRPSCYECHFKAISRVSDITLGDMRSVYKFVPQMDDDKGTTVIYVQSARGKEILEKVRGDLKLHTISINDVLSTSGKKMISCAKVNPKRQAFFSDIDLLSYEKLIDKYCPPDMDEYVANIVKGMFRITGLHRTGLFKYLKRK